jgi:hypothetical protein
MKMQIMMVLEALEVPCNLWIRIRKKECNFTLPHTYLRANRLRFHHTSLHTWSVREHMKPMTKEEVSQLCSV